MLKTTKPETWYIHEIPKKRSVSAYATRLSESWRIFDDSNLPDDGRKPGEVWIKESDSDFVRLCKLGGRPGLLKFHPGKKSSKPVGYPRPDWFAHPTTQSAIATEEKFEFGQPSWMHVTELDIGCQKNKKKQVRRNFSKTAAPRRYTRMQEMENIRKVEQIIPNSYLMQQERQRQKLKERLALNKTAVTKDDGDTTMKAILSNQYARG
ncbi:hypothetical protein SNEBB_002316 [Seison nebaliae]|nr:hypothetical protein SNEBB_002316 [Seison nebaliae]